jgi:cell shape-determining protein MreD
MTVAIMAFLLLVATLVQSLVPAVAWLGDSKLPCLLGVVLYYALTQSRGMVVAVAILAGIIQDSLSLIPLGYSALCFVTASVILVQSRGVLFRDSLVTVAMTGAIVSALTTLALYFMLAVGADMASVPLWWLALKMGGNALLGTMTAPVVWVIAGLLEDQVGIVHSDRL